MDMWWLCVALACLSAVTGAIRKRIAFVVLLALALGYGVASVYAAVHRLLHPVRWAYGVLYQ